SAPPGVAVGSQQMVNLTATYAYTLASLTRNHARNDTTIVGAATVAGLNLLKSVDKASAKTGDVLVYTIRFSNQSHDPLSNVRLNDITPAYTVFVTATCGLPLPNGITQCRLTQQPAAGVFGNIEWTLDGQLQP